MEKTQGARVKECVTLWRKLTVDLGIPHTYEGMLELKEEIDKYIMTIHKGFSITPSDSPCPYTWACYGPY